MAQIQVTRSEPDHVKVEVTEAGGSSVHHVKVTPQDVERFAADASAEALVEESFRFLLEREPKEAILQRFDLPVIARYFPDYPEEIRARMRG